MSARTSDRLVLHFQKIRSVREDPLYEAEEERRHRRFEGTIQRSDRQTQREQSFGELSIETVD